MRWVSRARTIYACYKTSSFVHFHTCLEPISFRGVTRFVAVRDYSTSTRLQQQKGIVFLFTGSCYSQREREREETNMHFIINL
jgi:hypothetical protein